MPAPRKPRAPRASLALQRVDFIADQTPEPASQQYQTSAVEVSQPGGGEVLKINVVDYSKA